MPPCQPRRSTQRARAWTWATCRYAANRSRGRLPGAMVKPRRASSRRTSRPSAWSNSSGIAHWWGWPSTSRQVNSLPHSPLRVSRVWAFTNSGEHIHVFCGTPSLSVVRNTRPSAVTANSPSAYGWRRGGCGGVVAWVAWICSPWTASGAASRAIRMTLRMVTTGRSVRPNPDHLDASSSTPGNFASLPADHLTQASSPVCPPLVSWCNACPTVSQSP